MNQAQLERTRKHVNLEAQKCLDVRPIFRACRQLLIRNISGLDHPN